MRRGNGPLARPGHQSVVDEFQGVEGFRVWGFRVWGFRVFGDLGVQGVGFRVCGLGA